MAIGTDEKLLGGMVTGVGIMAAGSAFNIVTMGMAGAGIACAFGAVAGGKMVKERFFPGNDGPDEPTL